MVDYDISLDMKDRSVIKTDLLFCSGDSGLIRLNVRVMDGSEEYSGEITKKQLIFRKQDGACCYGKLEGTVQPYTYVFRGSELDVPGPVLCDVKVYEADGRVYHL